VAEKLRIVADLAGSLRSRLSASEAAGSPHAGQRGGAAA
jgi:hypothetical protein